jgi:glycosyltransferase involved in cell wall biosynthesis
MPMGNAEASRDKPSGLVVGIDCRAANEPKRAGIGNYCLELLRGLLLLGEDVSFRIYLDRKPLSDLPLKAGRTEVRVLPPGVMWTFRRLAAELRRDPPDVFLSPGVQLPLFVRCPRIATVLDLAYFTFPSNFTLARRLSAKLWTYSALRAADHWLAISESTKQDMMRLLHVPENRITVTHLGHSARFRPCTEPEKIERVRRKYVLPQRYLLHVGRLQPRKNIPRLIDAFLMLRQRRPDLPHKLVIAGDKGWMYNGILEAAGASAAKQAIQLAGFVAEEDLPVMISAADLLVLISLWEGFGLPVVEAMACGTAVLTSNTSALAEVTGDAGLQVDPCDTQAITDAIERVLSEDSLREQLRAKGLARASAFTWENTARKTLAVLREIAGVRLDSVERRDA